MRDTTTCNNKVDNRKLLFDYFDDLVMNKIMEYITKENHRGLIENIHIRLYSKTQNKLCNKVYFDNKYPILTLDYPIKPG
jgi:hypothetical protein